MKKRTRIACTICPVTSDDNYLDHIGNEFKPRLVQLFRALGGRNFVDPAAAATIGLLASLPLNS